MAEKNGNNENNENNVIRERTMKNKYEQLNGKEVGYGRAHY